MLSWKVVKSAIQSSKIEVAALLIGAGLLMLVYNLHLDGEVILYPATLTATVIAVYLFTKALVSARFYRQLYEEETAPSEDEVTEDVVHKQVLAVIRNVHSKHLSEIYRLSAQIENKNALFSQLIHAMKSSAAVTSLACEKLSLSNQEANAAFDDIVHENEKLKKSLEQALNILRLEAFVNDYVPEKVELAEVVTAVINEHKRDFIYNGIYPQLQGGGIVYTDRKWLQTLITQLVSNAIKYSDKGESVIFEIDKSADGVALLIKDKGIGIPPEDLPRIFDMFFTGANGRGRNESTGIGLFMAKHIADSLGITISVDSEVGCGTAITLIF